MVRLGVLGAGSHSSSNHGPALQRCRDEQPERIELAAVCDLDVERARRYAARFGFARAYVDLERMVAAERLDGLVAVTPVEATAELAARIARLGVPLAIEKPPARTPLAVRRLRDELLSTGTPHMVSLNRRFSPALQRAREWLAGRQPPAVALSRMLRHDRREAGFPYDTGIHAVDAVVCFLGEPVQVRATRRPVGAQGTELVVAQAGFAGGGTALFCMAPAAGAVEETLELVGDEYDIQIDLWQCAVRIRQADQPVLAWQAAPGTPPWESNGTLAETRAFVHAVETGAGWWPDLGEAAWSSGLAHGICAGLDGTLPVP